MELKDQILDILNNSNEALELDEICKGLNMTSSGDFIHIAKVVNELEDDFILTHNKKYKFQTLDYFNLMVGTFKYHKRCSEVINDLKNIDISNDDALGAINNDIVMVSLKGKPHITRIIKRGNKKLIGVLKIYHHKYTIEPIDNNINLEINLSNPKNYNIGDYIEVRIDKYLANNKALGTITNLIAHEYDVNAYYKAITLNSININNYQEEIAAELNQLDENINSKEYNNRQVVNRTIITIDGEDAKDLDDAVSVEKLADGNYFLGVYIADVSYYVKDDTFLDLYSFERGTSIYYPGMVIPMLPPKLSNNLCSLNPHTDKLVMACEMIIDNKGEIISHNIFEGIINTKYRMTYNQVYKILNGDEVLRNKYQDIVPMLEYSLELEEILKEKRKRRGSFFFESSESEFVFNDHNELIDIKRRSMTVANNIIEEFMIAANETVAETMSYLDVPFIYRIHEKPSMDKINHLMMYLEGFNYHPTIKNDNQLKQFFQKVILENDANEEGIDEDTKTQRDIINTLMIRSMSKARYSSTNLEHFGLASKFYTHFTSPIRRYPDLLVHRLIKTFLLNKERKDDDLSYYSNKVIEASKTSSKMELISVNLERSAEDYKKCEYMEKYIGKSFNGIISHLTSFGFYVMLDNTIEGLVHISSLMDDYYNYDSDLNVIIGERMGKKYSLKDKIKVRLINVEKEKRQIDFIIDRR